MSILLHVKNRNPFYTGDLVEGVFIAETMGGFIDSMDNTETMRHTMLDKEGEQVTFTVADPNDLEISVVGYFSKNENHVIMIRTKGVRNE